MLYLRIVAIVSAIILLGSQVFGQSDWRAKNYDQWTKDDVEKILNDSAFAVSQEVRLQYEATQQVAAGSYTPATLAGGTSGNGTSRGTVNTISQGAIGPTVSFIFTLRMRSSLAIRLALIRKNELETDVKKLSDEEFALFKKKQIGLYECPGCAENYVLTLSSHSRENRNFDAVFSAFSNARLDDLKGYIFLTNDKGEKRTLVNFMPPKRAGDEAIFYFARFDEKGLPLLTKESKYFVFNSTKLEVNTVTNFRVDVAPMIVGDKVEF